MNNFTMNINMNMKRGPITDVYHNLSVLYLANMLGLSLLSKPQIILMPKNQKFPLEASNLLQKTKKPNHIYV